MLLSDLYAFNTVETAAAGMAGNWQKWRNFMFFGTSTMHKPENIMLGYTQTCQTGVKAEADHQVVAALLKPYMSQEDDPNFIVDDYGASLSGDRNALIGFAVRVYDDEGKITEAFEKLFDLSQNYCDEYPLDDDVFKEVNRRRMLDYLQFELRYLCKKRGIAYSDQLALDITDILVDENELSLDHLDLDEDVVPLLKEIGTPA
jgi:hypothetical protein